MIGKPTVSLASPYTSTLLAQTPSNEIEEPELREPDNDDEPELTEDPQGQSNPFLAPELDELVDRRISEDVWQQMLGELPCSVTTEDCIKQLQSTAIQNSRLLADMQSKIEEAENTVDEARQKNLDSIAISNFSPFLQAILSTGLTPLQVGTQPPVVNPFKLIFGNTLSAFLGKGLGAIFNWSDYAANDSQQQRAIAIGDIQIKIAELQRNKAELAQKLREQVTFEALKLEEIARNFQIEQEIAKRDKQRLEIAKVSYRFGEGDSERYLAQLSSYDRQKAATFREWSRLRSQVITVKLLVLGGQDDE